MFSDPIEALPLGRGGRPARMERARDRRRQNPETLWQRPLPGPDETRQDEESLRQPLCPTMDDPAADEDKQRQGMDVPVSRRFRRYELLQEHCVRLGRLHSSGTPILRMEGDGLDDWLVS